MDYSKKVLDYRDITLEGILKKTSEEYIYSMYLGYYPELKRMYKSPFKSEKTPSFNLYINERGKLRFKDYSSTYTGDIVTFVMLLYNLKYNEALVKIYFDINGKSNIIIPENRVNNSTRKYTPRTIEVITRDLNDIDINYWNKYHITREILDKYNIKPCDEVWLTDEKDSILWYKYNVRNNTNPCYRYVFNSKYKIYRPFEKKYKWLSNCNNHNNIQGIDQLFNHDTCIITKSYKDVICINEFIGIPSLALHGESHYIDTKIIEWLKSKYKNLILLYDNDLYDSTGVVQSEKFFNLYNVKSIFIPKEYQTKDISDFIERYGIEKANQLISFLIKNLEHECCFKKVYSS